MFKTYVSTKKMFIGGHFYNPSVPGCHVFPETTAFYSNGWLAKGVRIKFDGMTIKFGGVFFRVTDNTGFLSAIEQGWFKRVPLFMSFFTKQKPESLGLYKTLSKTQKRLEATVAWNNKEGSRPEPIESYNHAKPQPAPVFDGNSLFFDNQTDLPEIPEDLWEQSASGDLPNLNEIRSSHNV